MTPFKATLVIAILAQLVLALPAAAQGLPDPVRSPIGSSAAAPEPSTPTQSAQAVVNPQPVTGQHGGGLVWVEEREAFAVAIDDRVQFVDEAGWPAGAVDIPGASDPRVYGGHLFVGGSDGQISEFDLSSLELVNSWNTGWHDVVSLDVTSERIWFIDKKSNQMLHSINRETGRLERDRAFVQASFAQVRVNPTDPDIVYAGFGRLQAIDMSVDPYEVRYEVDLESWTDMAISPDGETIWVDAKRQHRLMELRADGLTEVGPEYEDHWLPRAVAASPSGDTVFLGASNSSAFDITFYAPGQERRVGEVEWDDFWLQHRSLAASPTHVAALGGVSDPDIGILLRMERYRPELFEDEITVEFGHTIHVTIQGEALDSISVATFNGVRTHWYRDASGTTLGFYVPKYPDGTYEVVASGPLGDVTMNVTLERPPAPEPEPTPEPTPEPEPEPEPTPEPTPEPEPEPAPEPEPTPEIADVTATACPWMTDSISRLYSAYFLRAPDAGGFQFWMTEYSEGNWGMARMSRFFSESPEFVERYGDRTDGEFIDLVYNNVLGRPSDQGGRDYWLGRMTAEGLTRGEVMLFFSESPEYVDQTGTATPFAGHFNWYPEGTTWACGFGSIHVGFPEGPTHTDLALLNFTSRRQTMTIQEYANGDWRVAAQPEVDRGTMLSYWAIPYTDGSVTGLALDATGDFGWIIVQSPEPTPRERAGW